ncbi:MAG TPA: dihydrodipicolinate synthase family protein [Thermoplasmata archaeon]|nr:dihydrodipicolinate synthase family protein [Thermoplasmata archaeon]
MTATDRSARDRAARARAPWDGVLVALTTPFRTDLEVDLPRFVEHARDLVARGADGVVVAGSLGEGAALSGAERTAMVAALAEAIPPGRSLVAAVGAPSTREAVALARALATAGARALLLLPPYVYRGDRREVHAHFVSVARATELPCMLYNNPAAYGTDVSPAEVLELVAEAPTLTAVKESSGDVRRVTALRALLGSRVAISVGLDDAVLEGVRAGATGWVAGLANALPEESVALFERARRGDRSEADARYRWFLPLLRMDTVPKFVQLVKLVESEVGQGEVRVRPPRLPLVGEELEEAQATIRAVLASRPPFERAPERPLGPGGARSRRAR